MFLNHFCFSLASYLVMIIECDSIKFDDQWDDKLMEKDANLKCGIENKFQTGPNARIINGKRIKNQKYSWVAELATIVFYPNNTWNEDASSTCTGSVISTKAILTAKHCLCRSEALIREKADRIGPWCLEEVWWYTTSTGAYKLRNQNHIHNQVHYSIGRMPVFDRISLAHLGSDQDRYFSKNIKAFLFKYNSKWWNKGTKIEQEKRRFGYFKNGDVGIIIDESILGLNLRAHQSFPICLPTRETFNEDLKVTAAGRGNLYDEYILEYGIDKGKRITSCMTNEGIVKNRGLEYANIQAAFLQCKDYDRDKRDSCTLVQDATIAKTGDKEYKGYRGTLLSTDIQIEFFKHTSGNVVHSGPPMKINIPKKDECEQLSTKIKEAISNSDENKKRLYNTDDGLGPSRILVLDKDEKVSKWEKQYQRWEKQGSPDAPYCYNLKRLNWYGICETENHLYNFGFCSISCKIKDPMDDPRKKGYNWALEANYYETKPNKADEYYCKIV